MSTENISQRRNVPAAPGTPSGSPEISVVIPVVERYDDLHALYTLYTAEIAGFAESWEVIFVIDGHMDAAYKEIRKFSGKHPDIQVIKFTRTLGESMAISAGFERSRGEYVFTLASYFQVEPEEIHKLYQALKEDECDVAVARRNRDNDSLFNRLQSSVFHALLRTITGARFGDISCGLKGMKRKVVEVFDLYGDLHRFIPILAEQHGLRVKEVGVRQRKEDTHARIYKLRKYFNRFIDVILLFYMTRFAFKPLRFFGIIGTILMLTGSGIILYLVYMRLFTAGFALRDKPSLFLASVLIVIGIQVFAVGLIGEVIIYTRADRLKRSKVKEIVK